MIGKTISHYRIVEKLGEGGMGVVYRARDTKLDRDVALKFLPPNLVASEEELARFEQEARAISALNHPAIATIYDVDEADGQKYIVLEYLPGGTLKGKLKRLKSEDGEFSLEEVTAYGIQIAEALSHAHRHGIIHRDVKTDNIMLTEEGKAKLTDFGLAKLRGSVQITKTASTVGTAAYMSPEQVRGEEVDHRTDVFSFGIVLYELVTSHLPFRAEFEAALNYAILNDSAPPLRESRPGVPPALAEIIGRCLEKDPAKRPQTAAEIAGELKKVEHDLAGPPAGRPSRAGLLSKKAVWIPAAIGVLLVTLYLFSPRSASPPVSSKWIAVLPFENLSDSKEDEYFSDGITDDIIAQLSKIGDLKVISRTSVMQYKGVGKNVREIGRDLGVGTVLEGSVRRSGNQLRIVAQLIDAANEGHLWVETYDKEMTQVFAIQSDVAQRIAAALQAKLSPSERGRIEKKQTDNTESYQLYLKGRFYWNKRRIDDIKTAIEYFKQAIEKDPGYAQAYAGLASTYVLIPQYGMQSMEWYAKADSAARKALEIDATLAEAYTVLGLIANDHEYDWAGAEKYFRRAIELDPGYPTAHQWYSSTLMYLGRLDEALAEVKRAHELDPLSLVINMNLGDVLYLMRQYDRAIEQYKSTLALDQDFAWARYDMAWAYAMEGKLDEAIAECGKAQKISGDMPVGFSQLGRLYARAGRKSDALRVLDELLRLSQQGFRVPCGIGVICFELGDRDKAFEWLEKAYQSRDVDLIYLGVDPLNDDIRSDPRGVALLKKMGLAQLSERPWRITG